MLGHFAGSFTWIYKDSFHAFMHSAACPPASLASPDASGTKECVLFLKFLAVPRGPRASLQERGGLLGPEKAETSQKVTQQSRWARA